ncbi:MAG: GNAT family N-acetyltransferase [Candidatus Yanofskybacteria bacterium]|nr:GNAT family N-acetyltransferase [Candidatus Yanofskybacteria bacterium]
MPDITFRKATIEDIDTFIEIEKTAVGLKVYSGITDKEEAKEEIENNEVYFIIKDGEIVGSTEYQVKSQEEAYLGGLVIKPKFQDKGIARQAIEFRLNKVKDKKRVWLVTHPDNSKVIKLYLSYGFVIESRKENYYGDGEPRLVLARQK